MSRRIDRVNELLRHEISRLLTLQINDPRLTGVITITRVTTTSDLRESHVFLSVMGDAAAKQDALEGIRSAAAYLRRELRPRLTLRYTPFLRFDLDQSMDEVEHILGIMDNIQASQSSESSPESDDQYIGPLGFPARGS